MLSAMARVRDATCVRLPISQAIAQCGNADIYELFLFFTDHTFCWVLSTSIDILLKYAFTITMK